MLRILSCTTPRIDAVLTLHFVTLLTQLFESPDLDRVSSFHRKHCG